MTCSAAIARARSSLSIAVLLVFGCLVSAVYSHEEDATARLQRLSTEAKTLYETGRYQEALSPARELLALTEQAVGPDHPLVSQSLNNLALLLQKTQQPVDARLLLERALATRDLLRPATASWGSFAAASRVPRRRHRAATSHSSRSRDRLKMDIPLLP